MSSHNVKIEKLVFGGQGLGRIENKVIFVWNALPGEEVEIEYIKNKKDFAEAVAKKIINPSPFRIEPLENHFIASSPWQVIKYQKENEWKKEIAIETYKKIGGEIFKNLDDLEIIFDQNELHYRNKMEFNFCETSEKNISLAFFERGKKIKMEAVGSVLASEEINETAKKLLQWINQNKITNRSLKTLIIRSNSKKETIAALFIKDELTFDNYPNLDKSFVGFQVYYSTHKSPASVPTKLLYQTGQNYLEENILERKLRHGIFSFFQVNIPIFILALKDIQKHVTNEILVDYYSGVGSIGLPLIEKGQKCFLVDNNDEAIDFATENIKLNNLINAEAKSAPSEKLLNLIEEDKIIVVDPPRAGLHQKVIEKLIEKKPKKIIYLSCNIATQARDISLLSKDYKIIFIKFYNFFPKTPHIEGLCVLEKIQN